MDHNGAEMIMIAVYIAIYLYCSVCLYVCAKKTNYDYPFLAFIPLLNLGPIFGVSKRSVLWLLACFIPILNIVAIAWIWMGIAEARGKNSMLGILCLIPLVNFIVMGYIAFVD